MATGGVRATASTRPALVLATADASPDAHARRLGRRQDPPLARGVALHTHPLARLKTTADQLVDFDGPDGRPLPPALRRPAHKKVGTTLLYGLAAMTATWASSTYSAVTAQVAALGSSLFLLGFRAGPAGVGAIVRDLRGPRRRAHAHVRRRRLLVRRGRRPGPADAAADTLLRRPIRLGRPSPARAACWATCSRPTTAASPCPSTPWSSWGAPDARPPSRRWP